MTLTAMMTVGEQVKAGQLVALAVTSTERNPVFKGIPTFAEQGYPDVRGEHLVLAVRAEGPSARRRQQAQRGHAAHREVAEDPGRTSKSSPCCRRTSTLPRVQTFLAEEYAFWAPLARNAGLKVQ